LRQAKGMTWPRPLLLALLSAVAARGADPFVLTRPMPWQVVQRAEGTAPTPLVVRGRATVPVDSLHLRVRPTEGGQASPRAESTVKVTAGPEGVLEAEWALPPGGWYNLEWQALHQGVAVASGRVERIGVGEVFVVAGQSNAGNFGSEVQTSKTSRVAAFDGTAWCLAADPMPGAAGKGGSFLPPLGDLLVEEFGVPVGFAAVAEGGTSVREWLPAGSRMRHLPTTGKNVRPVGEGEWEATGVLFDRLAGRLRALGPRGCRAVLWHQGESDAGQARAGYPADRQITGALYTQYMTDLIRASRTQAGWDVPWMTALTTFHSGRDPSDEEFRAAQSALWTAGLAWPGPDTDRLVRPFRHGVHFNGPGLREHAARWAEALRAHLPSPQGAAGSSQAR
jgi:hypothetical protein